MIVALNLINVMQRRSTYLITLRGFRIQYSRLRRDWTSPCLQYNMIQWSPSTMGRIIRWVFSRIMNCFSLSIVYQVVVVSSHSQGMKLIVNWNYCLRWAYPNVNSLLLTLIMVANEKQLDGLARTPFLRNLLVAVDWVISKLIFLS